MGSRGSRPRARVAVLPWLVACLLPRFLYPQRLLDPGVFAWRTLVPALGLTWLIFAAWNHQAALKIETTFASGQLQDFRDVTSDEGAVVRAIELKWADPKIKNWLREVMKTPSNAFTARQQAVGLFRSSGAGEPTEQERIDLLAATVTGHRESALPVPHWLAQGLWYKIKASSAAEAFNAQAALGNEHWRRAVDTVNPALADEKKKFAQRFLDAFAAEMNEPIRDMRRLNGWVQWLTILLACTIVVAVLRRRMLILQLSVSAQRAAVDAEKFGGIKPANVFPRGSEIADILQRATTGRAMVTAILDELSKLRDSADTAIYGLYASLAAAIPALGFIGTVIGMGAGLLYADGLFSSPDKQRVVGQITQGLGLAFDATLVSLICAPVAVIFQAVARVREQRMFTRWVGALNEARAQIAPNEARAQKPTEPAAAWTVR